MPKILAILLALLLLCCGKDQPAKQIHESHERAAENAKKLETEMEAKLKAEYEKRFGEPISEFELSAKRVEYHTSWMSNTPTSISVTRTATGAIAAYKENLLELELDIGEWLYFIRELRKCNVEKKAFNLVFDYNGKDDRELVVQFSSFETLIFTFDMQYHNNWSDVTKLMEAMALRIKKEGGAKLEAKLKMEYEKKFGISMTDFELSIEQVAFRYDLKHFIATRTANGVHIEYNNYAAVLQFEVEFDIDWWLDFVNALRKNRVGEWEQEKNFWEKKHYENGYEEGFVAWILIVNFSNKKRPIFSNINGFPPNWNEFTKAMNDFDAKIIAKAGAK